MFIWQRPFRQTLHVVVHILNLSLNRWVFVTPSLSVYDGYGAVITAITFTPDKTDCFTAFFTNLGLMQI